MKNIGSKILYEGRNIRNPYNIVQQASKKAAKHSNLIWENFLIKNGTKGLNKVLANEYVLIIQPKIASVKINFEFNDGKKGEANELPTPLNKLINLIVEIFNHE